MSETTVGTLRVSSLYSREWGCWLDNLDSLTPDQLAALTASLTPRGLPSPYVPHPPHPPQQAYLLLGDREALYGGAAGGGKSDALLMAAQQYVDVPGYAALLLRRTFQDLKLPDAIMDRADAWWSPSDARWEADTKTWRFRKPEWHPLWPDATVTFGYLATERDKYRYQGAAFQFVGFDELTQFTLTQYTYLFSRTRRPNVTCPECGEPWTGDLDGWWGCADHTDTQLPEGEAWRQQLAQVPLRVRTASNPGGVGHDWVKERFIPLCTQCPNTYPCSDHPGAGFLRPGGRIFVPARLEDNPSLDPKSYEEMLAELDPVTRAQLRRGDWDVRQPGGYFDRAWVEVVDGFPNTSRKVRYWDMAATAPSPDNPDPDYTVGALCAWHDGTLYVADMVRFRKDPGGMEDVIVQQAQLDGRDVAVRWEEEPGSSGKVVSKLLRRRLPGFDAAGIRSTGDKLTRAKPLSSLASHGDVKLVRGLWNGACLSEWEAFGNAGVHDDQVDACSGAYAHLTGKTGFRVR